MPDGVVPSRISLVIPCYNEAGRLPLLVDGLNEFLRQWPGAVEVVVVDDGSSDGTLEQLQTQTVCREYPEVFKLIRQANTGKGGALKAGVLAATGDWILTLDADMASRPTELLKWRQQVGTFDASCIYIASREHPDSIIKKEGDRKVAGTLFNRMVRTLTRLRTRDSQCGFKLYPAAVKPLFQQLVTIGWAHDVELLVRAQNQGFRIVDMPVTWNAVDGSKIRLFRDGFAMLIELWKISRLVRNER